MSFKEGEIARLTKDAGRARTLRVRAQAMIDADDVPLAEVARACPLHPPIDEIPNLFCRECDGFKIGGVVIGDFTREDADRFEAVVETTKAMLAASIPAIRAEHARRLEALGPMPDAPAKDLASALERALASETSEVAKALDWALKRDRLAVLLEVAAFLETGRWGDHP